MKYHETIRAALASMSALSTTRILPRYAVGAVAVDAESQEGNPEAPGVPVLSLHWAESNGLPVNQAQTNYQAMLPYASIPGIRLTAVLAETHPLVF